MFCCTRSPTRFLVQSPPAISEPISRPAIQSGKAPIRGFSSVKALKLIDEAGYAVGNVDSTLILAAPRIGPHAAAIQQKRGRTALALSLHALASRPRPRKAWERRTPPSRTSLCCCYEISWP